MKNKKANKHPKRILALKMQTKKERETKYGSPFMSIAWEARRQAIKKRLTKKKN